MLLSPFIGTILPTTLIQILTQIKIQIQGEHPECNQFLQIFDSNTEFRVDSKDVETSLTLPLLKIINSTNDIQFVQVAKHSRICSIILFNVSGMSFSSSEQEEELPSYQLPSLNLPGSPDRTFYLFIFDMTQKVQQDLEELGNSMRKILNGFILATFGENVTILRPSSNGNNLTSVTSNQSQAMSLQRKVDYNGNSLILTTCAVCGHSVDVFKKTGDWIVFFEAIIYELFSYANATLEFQTVVSLPKLERDDEGEWDPWVSPLEDGTAAIAAFQPYSVPRLRDFYFPQTLVFDRVTFLTAKPKRVHKEETIRKLLSPLSLGIWIGIIGAVVGLFVAIEIIIRFHQHWPSGFTHKKTKDPKKVAKVILNDNVPATHFWRFTLSELMKPSIGQGGNAAYFKKTIEMDDQAKGLVAVWLLALIVLGCAYQSEMTSTIVAPEYSKPPRTFRELVNSEYKTFAVLWDVIEPDFQVVSTDYKEQLLEAVQELQYFEPDCYAKIFQGENACIGLEGVMMNIAIGFLRDTKGRLMFLKAKEGLFTRSLSYAISKYHIDLKDRLEFIIRNVLSSGLIDHWTWNLLIRNQAKGMKFAQKNKRVIKAYDGDHKGDPDDNIVPVLHRVGLLGLGLSFVVFLVESFWKLVTRKVSRANPSNQAVITKVTPHFRTILKGYKAVYQMRNTAADSLILYHEISAFLENIDSTVAAVKPAQATDMKIQVSQ